ncbi:MAG TPA: hypothetical protein VKN99_24555 [Polyangia bacterium]|nr:hypothetical protein [Polyangia bacterium]
MAPEDAKIDERDEPKPADEDKLRARLQSVIPELVKRTFYAGLGAVFTTEEGVRKLVSDFSLPKDVANFLVSQAQGTKNEVFRIVATELRSWLDKIDLQRELTKLLTMLSVEVKTEIRFVPNEEALVKPEIKRKVSVKRAKPTEAPAGGGEDPAAAPAATTSPPSSASRD